MNISGAVKIDKLIKNDKQIILVGDKHTDYDMNGCRSILNKINYVPEFLYKIIKTTPELKWDFYLEQGIHSINGIPTASFLDNLETYYFEDGYEIPEHQEIDTYIKMKESKKGTLLELVKHYFNGKGCFIKDRCQIKNSRFHFIDIRQKNIGDCYLRNAIMFINIYKSLYMYLNLLKNWNKIEINKILDDFIEDILDSLSDISKCKLNKKIVKQISKSTMSKELLDFFLPINTLLDSILSDVFDVWENNKDKIKDLICEDLLSYPNLESCPFDFPNMKELLNKEYAKKKTFERILKYDNRYKTNYFIRDFKAPILGTVIIILVSNLMDMYSLGRMTKNYNKNIIVVAGNNHINTYRDFFMKNGWKLEWESKQIAEKCSTVPNIFKKYKKV